MSGQRDVRHARDKTSGLRVWWWVAGVVGVVVLALGAVGVYGATQRGASAQPPTETIFTTLPPPTPTIPIPAKPTGTPFFDALPASVNQYVLVKTEANAAWADLGAFDGYTLTYSDGRDEVTVLAGQWRTADEARAAFAARGGGAAPAPTAGPSAAAPPTSARWLNETAVFEASAATGDVGRFEAAFPM
jgi:hypothetical protein